MNHPNRISLEIRDFERFPVASILRNANPKGYAQCVDVLARARRYGDAMRPHVLGWDQRIAHEHDFIPWAAIRAGAEERFFSMVLPGPLGGGNAGSLPIGLWTEEIASVDAGLFVIYGAHALALSLVIASLDMRVLLRLAREITDAERCGEPFVLALAHTEAGGGSDVEDVDDIKHARIGSRWTKVPGGYRLSARKVFISNGSIARYNIVTAYGVGENPQTSMRGFLVPPDAPGFSVGRLEHKLGQRLSTAVEIICDDVFVPDADSFDGGDVGQTLDGTLSLTRGPVGAMAAGIIRGTLERTLQYVSQKRVNGHWLHEEQHVQLALADMLACLQAARGLYMDASFAGETWGVAAMMPHLPRKVPGFVRDSSLYATVMGSAKVIEQSRKLYYKLVPKPQLQRVTAHASAAKFMCSDLSVKCAMQAMEILGEDANDPRWGIEKQMRDAKLGQIFEGTNQINRLHVTRGLLSVAS